MVDYFISNIKYNILTTSYKVIYIYNINMCCNCKKLNNFYDLRTYTDKCGNEYYPYLFGKCLDHDSDTGFISKHDGDLLIKALICKDKKSIDDIPLSDKCNRKLINPIASMSKNTLGLNPNKLIASPFYNVDSGEGVFEMMEVYAKSLVRDKSFYNIQYNTDIDDIIESLNKYKCYITAPKDENNPITSKTLFRGNWKDELVGPYISQFLYYPFKYGNIDVEQKYLVEYNPVGIWYECQTGETIPVIKSDESESKSYVFSPQVLGSLVHNDPLYQLYYNAALIALQNGIRPSAYNNDNIDCWTSSGAPDVLASVAHVALGALRCAWYNKWYVGMKIRPEVFAHRINLAYTRHDCFIKSVPGLEKIKCLTQYGKQILDKVKDQNKSENKDNNESYLLKCMYTEGSPTHPSWPAGHAVVAGACVTVMKAMFKTHDECLCKLKWCNDDRKAKHSIDGEYLINYEDEDEDEDNNKMTIVGEFNKLASNISLGRDFAGVHYRADGVSGNLLGEEYAISYLVDKIKEYYETSNGMFNNFILEKFDGTLVKIDRYGEHSLC